MYLEMYVGKDTSILGRAKMYKSGFLPVNENIHFSALCQGNRDFKGELQGKIDVSLYFWPVNAMSIFDYRFN